MVVAATILSSNTLYAQNGETTYQARISLPEAEAAIQFSCTPEQDCAIQIGGFTTKILPRRSDTRVFISEADENIDLVFFDGSSSIYVNTGQGTAQIQFYDSNSPDYVVNGINNPAGSIELTVIP